MEFKNGDRVIDKKTGKKGMFTEYDWACKDLAWILYDGEKEEKKAFSCDLEIVKEKENVFSWIDYEENSFCQYGAALLKIDIEDDKVKENQLSENDVNFGKYIEYIIDKVDADCIK